MAFDEGMMLILGASLLASSAYALIAPFFPLKLEEKGISDQNIGFIFSIYSLAVIIFSPPVGRYLEVVGYTKMLISGLALMGTCFIAFGVLDLLTNPDTVFYVALLLRFVQGTACAMAYTTIYAIITNKYPTRKEKLLGMLEASFGVGLIFGPLAGASLYNMFGFEKTFYIYGIFFLICTFLLWYLIPELEFESRPAIETGGSGSSYVTRADRRQARALRRMEASKVDRLSGDEDTGEEEGEENESNDDAE